jgi:xylan 1,4-beta-xylosidase
LKTRTSNLAVFLAAILWGGPVGNLLAGNVELSIDASHPNGEIRALQGVNSGPIHYGELIDVSDYHREIGVPLTRLHDCHWPVADVVDIHTLFPDFNADPAHIESYDFRRTDDYLQSIVEVGSGIVFRLGESIEHSKRKYYVHPPADIDKWAAICVGVVRHYNQGWGHGFHHNIRYWEIWNEPENRPTMWSGTDEQYLRLYVVAAKAIKRAAPGVCVGGPALGYFGRMVGEVLEPSPFTLAFLDRCKRDAAPLDFFSWHTYTNDPSELVRRARAVRRLLDQQGYTKTESHLNEWNYLPDNDWGPMLAKDAQARKRWFDRLAGAEGAAFTAAALVMLQSAPLDAANYYSADIHGFGMFTEHGAPRKAVFALKAFKLLYDSPLRLAVDGPVPAGVAVGAGLERSRRQVTILASNFGTREERLSFHITGLPWRGPTACDVRMLDAQHDLTPISSRAIAGNASVVEQPVRPSSVCVIALRAAEKVH